MKRQSFNINDDTGVVYSLFVNGLKKLAFVSIDGTKLR